MSKNAVFLRTPYNYDKDAASNESGLHCEDASLAQQHYKEECDINTILQKFNISGILPENPLSPRYGDFTGIGDYHSALNRVIAAQDEFEGLPANIRARFDNDPAKLIEFLDDETNRPEAEELGLVEKGVAEVVETPKNTPEKAAE
ncbi:MAG: scaffolding protein [Burkholderiaceae bacterium]|nr:scaffolding protein [Burkholderiaceae bacterium]